MLKRQILLRHKNRKCCIVSININSEPRASFRGSFSGKIEHEKDPPGLLMSTQPYERHGVIALDPQLCVREPLTDLRRVPNPLPAKLNDAKSTSKEEESNFLGRQNEGQIFRLLGE